MLQQERLKRECLCAITTRFPPSLPCTEQTDVIESIINPFEPIMGSFGWFETFLKQALNKVEATSNKWATMAAIYNQTMDRCNFSNFVLGMLFKPLANKEPVNDIHVDTFAYIMRHNRENKDFLLEDLDLCSPVDLWLHVAGSVPSIPLWKAILFQYECIEKTTGNLFLSLWTQDAVVYYIEQYYSDNPAAEGITGPICENEFVRATYNFKALLHT